MQSEMTTICCDEASLLVKPTIPAMWQALAPASRFGVGFSAVISPLLFTLSTTTPVVSAKAKPTRAMYIGTFAPAAPRKRIGAALVMSRTVAS